jgi:plastocyanin
MLRILRVLIASGVAAAALLVLVGPSSGTASSTREFRMRDDGDPATFNAIGFGDICGGGGDTTFDDFIAQLVDRQVAGAWRFQPDETELDAGSTFDVVNRGGETHSFTPVVSFGGGGIVGLLDALSGNTTPAVLVNPAGVGGTFIPAGGTQSGLVVTPGLQQYQCLIHAWMRTTIVGK